MKLGWLESGYPDVAGLPAACADDRDGASSRHWEICWERERPAASRPDELG